MRYITKDLWEEGLEHPNCKLCIEAYQRDIDIDRINELHDKGHKRRAWEKKKQ